MTNPPRRETVPRIHLSPSQTGLDVDIVSHALATAGPAFFPRHRWFGDKARTIQTVRLLDMAFAVLVTGAPERIALTIVEITFADAGTSHYFLPLSLIDGSDADRNTLAFIEGPAGTWRLTDALAQATFHAWLLNPVASESVVRGRHGAFTWRPGPAFAAHLSDAQAAEPKVSGAEQSNSAVIYGHALLLKIFRRLQPGTNPDIEISRVLTEQTDFRGFPALLGDLTHRATDGEDYAIAMALPFVGNVGDAWAYTLSQLGDMLLGTAVELDLVAPFRRLGRRTGQLHSALATPTLDPAFTPEPITATDTEAWADDLQAALNRTLQALRATDAALPTSARAALAALTPHSPELSDRIGGFRRLTGIAKIRVHGDYHLGQVLVTPDEDVIILDFEGEPSRTIAERRAKTSPLKDVAGMLRSLAYARAATRRALPNGVSQADAEERLATWETDARDAFLAGYREETADRGASFVPADPAAFAAALTAWELDKAVYEINYELNNRPDWLPLPLSALLPA